MNLTLTDKNNKVFTMTLAELTDMTTDMPSDMGSLTDHDHSFQPFEPRLLDADGNKINIIQLADAIKADASKRPSALDVTFEATHSGRNANFFQYDSADLERDSGSWLAPFPKPLIKNHDTYQEPLGRVKSVSFGPSELTDEADCINVTFRVTDADAIDKLLDGRYRTMSIGAKTQNVRCNICGKDLIKDGVVNFCGHMRGQSYNGQKAYWTAKDFQFNEGSIVNNPADKWAQVKQIQVVKDDIKDSEDGEMPALGKPVAPASVKDSTTDDLSLIDNVIENENGEVQDQENPATEGEQGSEPTAQTDLTDDEATNELQALVDSVTAERDELATKIADFEAERQTLLDERAELEGRVEDAESRATELRQQNARLAVMNKTMLVDRALDFEELKDEAKEERRTELMKMKATELSDLIQTHISNANSPQVREMAAPISNPGLVDNSEKQVIEDEEQEKPKTQKVLTMKNLEDAAIELFTRRI